MKCSITGEIMNDPVCDPEGNTYERDAILEWLRRSNTSPVTRAPLTPEQLIPNRALRELIEQQTAVPTAATGSREERRRMVEQAVASAEAKRMKTAEETRARLAGGHPEIDESVQLEWALERQERGEATLMLSALPPEGVARTPMDICMVIDTSGSMNNPASTGAESDGLSLLDVVKHAVKTVRDEHHHLKPTPSAWPDRLP